MTATENQTIADMVVKDFARSTVFEKHQIDYCCHGKRTLREVCGEKGLSLEQIAAELDGVHRATDTRDWSEVPLAELASHIVDRHHGYLRTTVPSIAQKL